MKVGFVGLGRMGLAMATRILEAGHQLKVYNRSAGKTLEICEAGAVFAASIADVCAGSDVVITMLSDDNALEAVSNGEAGLISALEAGAVHLAMGTHSVELMRTLTTLHTDAGKILVAAPVLGRADMAALGKLGIVPGGPAAALEKCQPLFDILGRRTFDAGDLPESASAIKIANNFVLGCAIETMGEAFSLVRKFGVEPQSFCEVLTDGLFTGTAHTHYGNVIAREDYDTVAITAELGLKDANLALSAADMVGVPLPSADVWKDRLQGAIENGDGQRDWSVVALEQARASGIK